MRLIPKLKRLLPVVLVVYLTSNESLAQTYLPASAVGAGRTGHATVDPGESIYLNPAAIPHIVGHHLFLSGTNSLRTVSLTDNTKDSVLPGAITWLKDTSDAVYDSQVLTLSLAEFVLPKLSVGLTLRHMIDEERTHKKRYYQTNFDIGLLYAVADNLGIGLVARNLMNSNGYGSAYRKLESQYGLGGTYIFKEFARFKADVVGTGNHAFKQPEFRLGMETFFTEWSVFKFGYRNDTFYEKIYNSIGLGFHGPVFYLDWSYEYDTKMSRNHAHFIDLGIPF